MALRPSSSGQNLSFPQNTDRCAGFLVCARKIVAGGNWRFNGMGDGRSVVTSTPGTDIFTENGGLGYPTANRAWNTNTANSWYNPNAWFRIQAMSGGSPTGLEVIFQRSSLTAAGNERPISITVYLTTNSVAGNATTPVSGSTTGLGLYSGTTPFANSNTQSVINGNESIIFHAWDCDVPSGATGNVCALGMRWHSGINTNKCGVILIEPLVSTDAADNYPMLVMGGDWTATLGDAYASNYTTLASNSNVTCFAYSGSAWQKAVAPGLRNAVGNVTPVANSTTYAADQDGYKPIYPMWIERFDGTSAVYKGCCETIGRITPGSASDCWPLLIQDADSNKWITGWYDVWPWPNISTNPTGYSLVTDTNHWKKRLFPGTVDTTAPVISLSPSAGAVPYSQQFTLQCTDLGAGLAGYDVSIDFTTPDKHELVGRTGAATGASVPAAFSADDHYTVTESTITNGKQLLFARTKGLFAACSITVTVWDKAGQSQSITQAYTLSSNNDATVGSVTPTASTTLAYNGSQAFTISIPRTLKTNSLIVRATHSTGNTETVYAAGALVAPYSASSTATLTGSPVTSAAFTVIRTNGFPGTSTTFSWECIDADGVRVSGTIAQTITGNSISAGTISPASGGSLAYNGAQTVTLTVPQTIKTAIVKATYSTGKTETVYANGALVAPYNAAAGSTATSSPTTSLALSLKRSNGFPGTSVVFDWEVVDNEGSRSTGTISQTITGNSISVGSVVPAASSTLAYNGSQALTLTVPQTIKTALVRATHSGRTETVYANALLAPYITGSTATVSPTTSLALSISRDNGFPTYPTSTVTFDWEVVDNEGARSTGSITQTLTGTNPTDADVTAPIVVRVSPVGKLSKNGAVVLDVVESKALRGFFLYARFPGSTHFTEPVYISTLPGAPTPYNVTVQSFVETYTTRLTIYRKGGWSAAPVFEAFAIDTSGNMSS